MPGPRPPLRPEHAHAIAAAYDAGTPTGPMRAVARGELGRIWRLPASRGDLAVKELRHPPTESAAAADVRFQLRARGAGIVLPEPRLRPDGAVLSELEDGPVVRAYAWMDLAPIGERPVALVGGVLATLHGIAEPAAAPPNRWYTDPVGEREWQTLAERAGAAGSPFATSLRGAVPDLVALERLLPAAARADAITCHLDLDDSNLAFDRDGRLVVLDWENAGPASAAQDLAMLMGDYGADAGPALVRAYVEAGGPARITGPRDFDMAVAVQGHLIEVYANRWLAHEDAEDVARSAWRLETALGEGLLTPERIDRLVDTARP